MSENRLLTLLSAQFEAFKQHFFDTRGSGRLSDTLIISLSDGYSRAKVVATAVDFDSLLDSDEIKNLIEQKITWAAKKFDHPLKWLRLEWVNKEQLTTWRGLQQELKRYKRNYFRSGIAVRGMTKPWCLMTEMELNANACLYSGVDSAQAKVNRKNFDVYFKSRHGSQNMLKFVDKTDVLIFNTAGIFFDADTDDVQKLCTLPRHHGHREMPALTADSTADIIAKSTAYLAKQVQAGGRFEYGHFPCFGRTINFYNTLRHASSVYATIEGYEFCRENGKNTEQLAKMASNIKAALQYLVDNIIRHYDGDKAYVVEENGEIKLGANAVGILALVKYYQVFSDSPNRDEYLKIAGKLANGILAMQKDSGQFVHVLSAETLDVVAEERVIYYDGEAAFGLMRLYGVTKDPRWLACVEKAFDYFISAGHNGAHDHWLSYCSNELVMYKPEKKYFQFAVNNVKGYTKFIRNRITTFPTLLELSMAFHNMLLKLDEHPEHQDVLEGFDVNDFYESLHARANYLINGFFFPEMAMYFKKPDTILHGCFIRHHAFRVRIDDVEHYLSGWVAYHRLLQAAKANEKWANADPVAKIQPIETQETTARAEGISTIAWGGDVNLGRRQHYMTPQYGVENVLNIPALKDADFSIVNLECVVSVSGEQGRVKGEGGPYYYRARPEMVDILRHAGVDAVTCANNHSGDYGAVALREQKAILDAAGIQSAGTGENKAEAFAPIYRQLPNGVCVAVFSVDATIHFFAASDNTAGAAYIAPKAYDEWTKTFTPLFKTAKQQADLVLVSIHWGANGRETPDADELAIGRRLIDAGADAILGASAHQLQGIEVYQGKAIIHDAGDLLFDAVVSKAKAGGIFQLDISRYGIERVRFSPVAVGFGQTKPQSGIEAVNTSRHLAGLCDAMGTAVKLYKNGTLSVGLEPSVPPAVKQTSAPSVIPPAINHQRSIDYKQWAAENRNDLVFDAVPEDAKIEPISFGAMQLVGIRTKPYFFNRRRMLWVESFWQTTEALSEDMRIHFRANPTFDTDKMRPWGMGMEHDPCDWLMPTSRWQVGKVYRDFYGLRPPYMRDWEDGNLQLEVGVVSDDKRYPFIGLPLQYTLYTHKEKYADSLAPHMHYRQQFLDRVYENHTGGTWNAEQLASITRGKWLVEPPKGWTVDSLVAGSKHIGMAEGKVMFVANSNDNRAAHENSSKRPRPYDRHTEIARQQANLAGAIVSHPVEGLRADFPVLQVADPLKAWIELGIAARTRFANPVIAVTGTVGKSSACKMIETMFGAGKRVLCSMDNYNSRVGVPGTMASLSPEHDAAVVEVAQSALWMQRGPITRFIRPDVAVLTEVGLSQTQQLTSLEKIVRNKCRIFDGLSRHAIAVVGAHLPYFNDVLKYAKQYSKRVIIFGDHKDAEIRLKSVDSDFASSRVTLVTDQGEYSFNLPAPSMGMVKNAMAAFAVMYALGEDLNKALKNIENLESDERRFDIAKIPVSGGEVTVFDDSFNAEYDSMVNAFSLFKDQKQKTAGRHIYVLGRIVHLGKMAQAIHESLAAPLLDSQPDLVVTHGDEMRYLRDKLPKHLLGEHFSNAEQAASYIRQQWQAGDVVLVKGSSRDSDFGSIGRLLSVGAKSQKLSQAPTNNKEIKKTTKTVQDSVKYRPKTDIFNADNLVQVTGGYWLDRPKDGWFTTGLCTWRPTFKNGHLLVARKQGYAGGMIEQGVKDLSKGNAAGIMSCEPERFSDIPLPKLIVKDNAKAILDIGIWARACFTGKVIGVTGSVGKSTTIAMLNHALSPFGGVAQTERNLNVLLGIASLMSGFSQNKAFWLLEMALGEMRGNAELVRPHAAIVTHISEAHTEDAPTLDEIAEQKSRIFEHMLPHAPAVINRDIEQYKIFADKAHEKQLKIISFGQSEKADIRLLGISENKVKLAIYDKEFVLKTTLPEHQVMNILGVLGVILSMGLPMDEVLKNLESFQPLGGRCVTKHGEYDGKQITVIDDSFNATPLSLRAGLSHLQKSCPNPMARVVILGDIAGLGQDSVKHHVNIKETLQEIKPDRVLLCGAHMKFLWEEIKNNYNSAWYEDSSQIILELPQWLEAGDVVFVKGSMPAKMQMVVREILK